MERVDDRWFACQESNQIIQGKVETVDPIRMKVVVKVSYTEIF